MITACPFCTGGHTLRLMELPDANQKTVPIYSCSDCHVLFPDYAAAAIATDKNTTAQVAFHDDWWKAMSEAEAAELLAGCRAVVEHLKKYLPESGTKVFEIGSGRGGMLAAFRAEGFAVEGCEASSHLAGLGRQAFGLDEATLANVPVVDFLPAVKAHEGPKSIVLWHVLEHLTDAGSVWSELVKLCRSGDTLVLQLPCLVTQYIYPEHLFFPTEATILRLAARGGLDVLELSYDHERSFLTVVLKRNGSVSVPAIVDEHRVFEWLTMEREVGHFRERIEVLERDLSAAQALCDERLGHMKEHEAEIARLSRELESAKRFAEERLATINKMDGMIRERDAAIQSRRFLVKQLAKRVVEGK